jgi:hypothetical protein
MTPAPSCDRRWTQLLVLMEFISVRGGHVESLDGGVQPPNRDIVDIDLGDGTVIPVEVAIEPTDKFAGEGRSDASFRDWWDGGRRVALDRAAPTIKGMARWVHAQMEQIDAIAPDRVGVEMGIKFIARSPDLVSPVLGQASGEATLLVRLEWDLRKDGDRHDPPSQPESSDDGDEASPSGEDG